MSTYLSHKIKILSLLAMVMVVLIHAYNYTQRYLEPTSLVTDGASVNRYLQLLLSNGLTRWAIPLFFLISGYLNYPTQPRPYGQLVRKRMRTLLLPYLLWSAIGLSLYWLVQHDNFLWLATQKAALEPFDTIKIQDYSGGKLLIRWLLLPLPFQLWFLRCLLVYSLLMPLLLRGLRRFAPFLWVVFGILWFFNIGFFFVEGEGLLFFSLGLWLRLREVTVQQPPKWFRLEWFTVGWLILLLLKTAIAFGPYEEHWRPVAELLLYRIAQVLGVLVIWFGYDALLRGRLPAANWLRLTAFTFIIYGFHVPLLHILTEASLLFWGEQEITLWWVYLGSSVGAISICVGIGALLKTLAPAAFGVLTGGRGLG